MSLLWQNSNIYGFMVRVHEFCDKKEKKKRKSEKWDKEVNQNKMILKGKVIKKN